MSEKLAVVVEDRYGSSMITRVDTSDLRSVIIRLESIDNLISTIKRSKNGTDTMLIMEDYSK